MQDKKYESKDFISQRADKIQQIFDDPESKRNIIGLYDLLLKIAKRNPQLWVEIQQDENND